MLIVVATEEIHSLSSHIALAHCITLHVISALHTLVCSQFTHSPITTYVTINIHSPVYDTNYFRLTENIPNTRRQQPQKVLSAELQSGL